MTKRAMAKRKSVLENRLAMLKERDKNAIRDKQIKRVKLQLERLK